MKLSSNYSCMLISPTSCLKHKLFKTKGFMIAPVTLSSVPGMLSESLMDPGVFEHYALISNPGSKFSIQQIYPVASQALRM